MSWLVWPEMRMRGFYTNIGGGQMTSREQKEARLAELKAALVSVEGTQTEVYSRIVGYYRSVRNWNAGKREEFSQRVEFAFPQAGTFQQSASKGVQSYLLFSRVACPNCPPVKEYLARSAFAGTVVDVDTADGLDLARQYEVLSTPTAILLGFDGEELSRANSKERLMDILESVENVIPVSAIA